MSECVERRIKLVEMLFRDSVQHIVLDARLALKKHSEDSNV